MKKGHVFQVAHVQHALKWWDSVLAGLSPNHTFHVFSETLKAGVGIPVFFRNFYCPGTNIRVPLGTYAVWKCPTEGIRFPSLVSQFLLQGTNLKALDASVGNDLDNTVYPICSSCNTIMDSDKDQKDILSDGSPTVSVGAMNIYDTKAKAL